MIGLVETWTGRGAVRLDEIERIDDAVPNRYGAQERRARLRDGTSFTFVERNNTGLLARPVQIIPALPGTSIIRAYAEAGEAPEVLRNSVIAWGLGLDGEVRPITPNGVCDADDSDDIYVELPNGSIESVGEHANPCAFPNAEEMLAHFVRARHRRAVEASTGEQQA